jgi:hypothetical protein
MWSSKIKVSELATGKEKTKIFIGYDASSSEIEMSEIGKRR